MASEERPLYFEPSPGEGGMSELHFCASSGDWAGVCAAIKAGQDVNSVDDGKWTPLHWVVDMGSVAGQREEIVATLIESGADLEARDFEGTTPLLRACMTGNEDLVRQLIAAGADWKTQNKKGWTPFLESVRSGYGEMVATFLDCGASIDERSPGGETSLELARRIGRDDVCLVLESWNAARGVANDWLQLLADEMAEEAEEQFYQHLVAIETGCSIQFWFRADSYPGDDLEPLRDLDTRLRDDVLWRDFVRDWHHFLDLTSLVVDSSRYDQELCLIFRSSIRYIGSAAEWARIQAQWADRTRFRGRNWTSNDFSSASLDSATTAAMDRFVALLRKHRQVRR